ncbi:MAG: hypothetical protein I8H86_08555 [Sphingomonadaceae bacterium]|nr:hypothetical protein [Sphingomonadaceae bacterium]
MRNAIFAGFAILTAISLTACSEKAQDSLENAGAAISNDVDSTLDHAGDRIDNGLDRAGRAINNGAERVGATTDQAARDADRKADAAKRNVGESLEKAGNDLKNE